MDLNSFLRVILDDQLPWGSVELWLMCVFPRDCAWDIPLWTSNASLGGQLGTKWKGLMKSRVPFLGHSVKAGLQRTIFKLSGLHWVPHTDRRNGAASCHPSCQFQPTPMPLPWAACVHFLRLPFTNGPVIPDLSERFLPKHYRKKSDSLWIIPVIDCMLVSS